MAKKKNRAVKAKSATKRVVKRATKTAKASSRLAKRKVPVTKRGLQGRFEQINQVISRFEKEAEQLIKKIMKQGERSRKDLRRNFDDIAKKVRQGKLMKEATATRDELEKEVRRVAEEVIVAVKEIEGLLNTEKVGALLTEVRGSLSGLVEVLSSNGFILQMRETIKNTRQEVLGLFSIPSQKEVEKLERKIVSLEKRLSNLSRKAA